MNITWFYIFGTLKAYTSFIFTTTAFVQRTYIDDVPYQSPFSAMLVSQAPKTKEQSLMTKILTSKKAHWKPWNWRFVTLYRDAETYEEISKFISIKRARMVGSCISLHSFCIKETHLCSVTDMWKKWKSEMIFDIPHTFLSCIPAFQRIFGTEKIHLSNEHVE